jgi:hypothetical protein
MISAAGVIGRTIVVPDTGWSDYHWGSTYLQLQFDKAKKAGVYTGMSVEMVAENI